MEKLQENEKSKMQFKIIFWSGAGMIEIRKYLT